MMCLQAQTAVGSWRSHLAYRNATQCVAVGDKVYAVSDGSLYSYSPEDEFVECYDKTNLLSDQGIRYIAADAQTNTLVIVYNNANIDLMHPDGNVTNVSDFASETRLDPAVNGISIIGGKAYLATNFGVTILNVEREEFENTYILNKKTYSSVELNGIIYAATENGMVDTYIHMGGKVGIMVELSCAEKTEALTEVAHDIALQIAAASPVAPEYVRRSEVRADHLEHEKEILAAQARNEGKPEKIIEKMVQGRINKFYEEVCLVEQIFVKDGDKSVQQMINEKAKGLEIVRFTRYKMGDGLEKKVSDLAAEVAEQIGKK